jgi:TonB family protein
LHESKAEGKVVVEVIIEVSGMVADVKVVESSDEKLNRRALVDAGKWRFEPPATRCRTRVPIQYTVQSHNKPFQPIARENARSG